MKVARNPESEIIDVYRRYLNIDLKDIELPIPLNQSRAFTALGGKQRRHYLRSSSRLSKILTYDAILYNNWR